MHILVVLYDKNRYWSLYTHAVSITTRLANTSISFYTKGEDMPLSLTQIRQNCKQARERMAQARSEHWAFGAFNLDDEATLKAVSQAAASKKAPVLVEVSQ